MGERSNLTPTTGRSIFALSTNSINLSVYSRMESKALAIVYILLKRYLQPELP